MKKSEKKEYVLEYNMVTANVLCFALLFIMFLITCVIMRVFNLNFIAKEYNILEVCIFFVLNILWMVFHEIIHYIAYIRHGADSKNVVFGASIENGVFYCKCKEYINRKCIMTSLLAPFFWIGIVTYIIGLIIKSPLLVLLSILNISGAAGDLMMFFFFLKQNKDVEFKELGFSSPFVLRTSEDILNKKYFGIKNIRLPKSDKEINEGPEKKVTISKASWVFIIVMALLLIIPCIILFVLK